MKSDSRSLSLLRLLWPFSGSSPLIRLFFCVSVPLWFNPPNRFHHRDADAQRKARWPQEAQKAREGIADGSPAVGTQTHVYVLQKENRRWKIALMSISQLTFEKKAAPAPVAPPATTGDVSAPARLPNPPHGFAIVPPA
jgi:hypothetical protein